MTWTGVRNTVVAYPTAFSAYQSVYAFTGVLATTNAGGSSECLTQTDFSATTYTLPTLTTRANHPVLTQTLVTGGKNLSDDPFGYRHQMWCKGYWLDADFYKANYPGVKALQECSFGVAPLVSANEAQAATIFSTVSSTSHELGAAPASVGAEAALASAPSEIESSSTMLHIPLTVPAASSGLLAGNAMPASVAPKVAVATTMPADATGAASGKNSDSSNIDNAGQSGSRTGSPGDTANTGHTGNAGTPDKTGNIDSPGKAGNAPSVSNTEASSSTGIPESGPKSVAVGGPTGKPDVNSGAHSSGGGGAPKQVDASNNDIAGSAGRPQGDIVSGTATVQPGPLPSASGSAPAPAQVSQQQQQQGNGGASKGPGNADNSHAGKAGDDQGGIVLGTQTLRAAPALSTGDHISNQAPVSQQQPQQNSQALVVGGVTSIIPRPNAAPASTHAGQQDAGVYSGASGSGSGSESGSNPNGSDDKPSTAAAHATSEQAPAPAPVLTLNGTPHTAASSAFVISGQTLAPSHPVVTLVAPAGSSDEGQPTVLSLLPSGSGIAVGPVGDNGEGDRNGGLASSRITFNVPATASASGASAGANKITMANRPYAANEQGVYTIADQTLSPGGSTIMVSGTPISLGSAMVSSTSGPDAETTGETGNTVAPSQQAYVIGSQTLTPGGTPVTAAGTTYILASNGASAVVDGKTVTVSSATASVNESGANASGGLGGFIASGLGASATSVAATIAATGATPTGSPTMYTPGSSGGLTCNVRVRLTLRVAGVVAGVMFWS